MTVLGTAGGRHGGAQVIKLGGRVQRDDRLGAMMAAQWQAHRGALCVVHGGGDAVSALQRALGVEPTFVEGRRVTAAEDIDLLRMVLSGAANKRLVDALVRAGAPAVGLSGEDGALLAADVADGGALGAVGRVRAVNTTLIAHLWAGGYLPVISPLASPGLNVNGDDAAAAIAVALGVDELLLLSDVPGVRMGGVTCTALSDVAAREGLASGEITGGMIVKIRSALAALDGGVHRVRIGGLDALAEGDGGTVVSRAPARAELAV